MTFFGDVRGSAITANTAFKNAYVKIERHRNEHVEKVKPGTQAQPFCNYDYTKLVQSIIEERNNRINQLNNKYHEYISQLFQSIQTITTVININCNIWLQNAIQNPNNNNTLMELDSKCRSDSNLATTDTPLRRHANEKKVVINRGITYRSLFKQIGSKLYICKVCNKYYATFLPSMLKHLRKDHKKKAKLTKYKYQLNNLQSVPNFDFHLLNKKHQSH